MTKREAAIVSAYTEILLGDMNELYKYLEEKAGRPVYTHEAPAVRDKYREEIEKDFLSIKVES